MTCYAVQHNLSEPAEGNSGSRPDCVATSAVLFIGDKIMEKQNILTRVCVRCKIEKPLKIFTKNKGKPEGYGYYCKECYRINARECYWKNRGRRSIYHHKRGKKLKKIVIEHYGGKCANCKITDSDILTIDHINNDGAEHRKKIGTGHHVYNWIIQNDFPDGFQILCCNCNWKKEVERRREAIELLKELKEE